jgi:phosphohistidine phosphatase
MKQLLLIRHAKSSWDDAAANDMDRPLNERGKKDAPKMAERLLDKKVKIDGFYTSPAKRALSTCRLFVKSLDRKEKHIIEAEELYEPNVESFFNVIRKADEDFDTIAIFSHNPGITAFANKLTSVQVDDMPTCSIFAIKADIKKWNDFEDGEKLFWFFDYPKLKA